MGEPKPRQCGYRATGSGLVCGLQIEEHTQPPCEWCGGPPEHHRLYGPDRVAEERAGRARMASARQRAGQPLDAGDRKALGL